MYCATPLTLSGPSTRGVSRPIGEVAAICSVVGMFAPSEESAGRRQFATRVSRQRLANSILNPFSLCGLASRSAASAALRKFAALAGWPTSAASASGDRHGFVPTPPRAMRARVTFAARDREHDGRRRQRELVRRPVAQLQIHLLASRDRAAEA